MNRGKRARKKNYRDREAGFNRDTLYASPGGFDEPLRGRAGGRRIGGCLLPEVFPAKFRHGAGADRYRISTRLEFAAGLCHADIG